MGALAHRAGTGGAEIRVADGQRSLVPRGSGMVGLRLERLTVVGVCTKLNLQVRAGSVRAAVVRDQPSVDVLADVIVGLHKPSNGRVFVDDTVVSQQHTDHRRHRKHRLNHQQSRQCGIRLVPADGWLEPQRTVFDHILQAQCPTAPATEDATKTVQETVSAFGLEPIAERRPEHLTPTERQLLGLARAMCWKPSAVVLEDAPGQPTWDAVFEDRRRRVRRTEHVGVPDPPVPHPFVAMLIITTDAARVRQLDDDPVGVEPGGVR
ncbi:ATP-binding cassette domain-containing protein [Actinopolymorpha sp. B17G11]|uniref:ATP-binding cassette domain-containing protein n=1 Tax=Actinopolymorpha sp. B17G11 TaxID=3160861 RepID=UPI0032E47F52